MKRTFRNDSIEDINKINNSSLFILFIYIFNIKRYTVTVIPDCVPEKVAYLKERAGTLGSEVGTLVFQPQTTLIVVGHCVLTAYTISK